MSDTRIRPWHITKVTIEVTVDTYSQSVHLNSGDIVTRTMKREGPGTWRGTERADVFENQFDEDDALLEALDDAFIFPLGDVAQALYE